MAKQRTPGFGCHSKSLLKSRWARQFITPLPDPFSCLSSRFLSENVYTKDVAGGGLAAGTETGRGFFP